MCSQDHQGKHFRRMVLGEGRLNSWPGMSPGSQKKGGPCRDTAKMIQLGLGGPGGPVLGGDQGPKNWSREAERPARSQGEGARGLPAERHCLSPPPAGSDRQVPATGLDPRPCSPPSFKKLGAWGCSPPPGKCQHTLPKRKGLFPGPWFATPGFSHTISESWLLLLFLTQLQRNSRLSHTNRSQESGDYRAKLNDHTWRSWAHTRQIYDCLINRKKTIR